MADANQWNKQTNMQNINGVVQRAYQDYLKLTKEQSFCSDCQKR